MSNTARAHTKTLEDLFLVAKLGSDTLPLRMSGLSWNFEGGLPLGAGGPMARPNTWPISDRSRRVHGDALVPAPHRRRDRPEEPSTGVALVSWSTARSCSHPDELQVFGLRRGPSRQARGTRRPRLLRALDVAPVDPFGLLGVLPGQRLTQFGQELVLWRGLRRLTSRRGSGPFRLEPLPPGRDRLRRAPIVLPRPLRLMRDEPARRSSAHRPPSGVLHPTPQLGLDAELRDCPGDPRGMDLDQLRGFLIGGAARELPSARTGCLGGGHRRECSARNASLASPARKTG